MIAGDSDKLYQKHAKLSKPNSGEFGRNEIAILGTTCSNIRRLAYGIIKCLAASYKVSYIDADHKSADQEGESATSETALKSKASIEFTDKISYRRLDYQQDFNPYQKRMLFNEQDLVLINGNHFPGKSQIIVIDPAKPLEKKLDRLTNVKLILLKDKSLVIPDYIKTLPQFENIPVILLDEQDLLNDFILNFLGKQISPLKALVLSGGKSSRMKSDKGNLNYHGTSQREYLYNLFSRYCQHTYISCNNKQVESLPDNFNYIEDSFLNLGPLGGILSALQSDPNSAWLTVACDLPYLSEKTIQYLIQHRNPSKTATAFLDSKGEFPEPLITIWEPKSYGIILQFLSQGYSCPRKVLINSDVEILQAPDTNEFRNVNFPEEYEQARRDFNRE